MSDLHYTMDELLTQRENAQHILRHAENGGWPAEIKMAEEDLAAIDADIEVKAKEMADDVEAVLDQTLDPDGDAHGDERPYDWEVDGDGN